MLGLAENNFKNLRGSTRYAEKDFTKKNKIQKYHTYQKEALLLWVGPNSQGARATAGFWDSEKRTDLTRWWEMVFKCLITKFRVVCPNLLIFDPYIQSHYREVPRWEIFMEQELRFGLDLGRFDNFWGPFFHVFMGKKIFIKPLQIFYRLRNIFNCVLPY